MSVILVFLVVVIGLSLWWLAQQRVLSRPWLEVGPDPVGGPSDTGLPTAKIALGICLAVIGALFALFASAYSMRMEYADWREMPIPRVVWVNTALLVLASVLLHCAVVAARKGDGPTLRLGLGAGAVATLAFLLGQLAAWRELGESGFLLTSNPADSFFYILTGLHGLHVVGGLVALAWAAQSLITRNLQGNQLVIYACNVQHALRLELCATYWHFLLLVWLGLLVLFTGTVAEVVAICRSILT